jgi:hypothetical protein
MIAGFDAPPGCWAIINTSTQSKALVAREADLYMLDYSGQCEKQVSFRNLTLFYVNLVMKDTGVNCTHMSINNA